MNQPPKDALGNEDGQDVEVILVVKGAGVQRPCDVLQQFLRGFWPAVNDATKVNGVPQTANKMRLLDLEDYDPPAHVDKDQEKLVEISIDPLPGSQIAVSTKHVWVKEAYWELGGPPPGRWRSLLNEWHIASYALTAELCGWLRSIVLTPLDWLMRRIDPQGPESGGSRAAPASRVGRLLDEAYQHIAGWDFFFNFASYWLFYVLLFLVLFMVLDASDVIELGPKFELIFGRQPGVLTRLISWATDVPPGTIGLMVAAILALLLSWAPAYRIATGAPDSPARHPGLHPIILFLMVVSILWNNWLYLGILLLLVAPLIIGNFNRRLWWKHRVDPNTDRRYHRLRRNPGSEGDGGSELLHIYPDLVWYRLLVLWFLPIVTLALSLADILIFTRILGNFGRTLERWINNLLGGLLGDVSVYALDPPTAMQVRSAVEYDIHYFADIERVRHIHVFAHSQGTPVSFETLFNHMPKDYRGKIKTYVTIGSVLGLYYVVAPALDDVPLPGRFRKMTYEEGTFADGFRWFNCWNLLDNVTSFCGLDAYDLDLREKNGEKEQNQDEDNEDKKRQPTNIRTRTKGHSEYWSNLKEVQVPFARRVIENVIDDKWKIGEVERTWHHAVGEALSWLLLAAGGVALVLLLNRLLIPLVFQPEDRSLWALLSQLVKSLGGALNEIDLIRPILDGLGKLLSPLGQVVNDDGLRTLVIIAVLLCFGIYQFGSSIKMLINSKSSPSQEA